ncbi:hypothetical protein [Deinococcus radiophilus]|uniref:Uncharacterized protein n=1 Tax=Deinococcus radiophilus TaxID=32062 RepID=A0A3S0JRP6_9DEIO|nr:hypothetical protein [Deinococcus radiophilus]RTR27517.1 hypothetical protein EJ104_06565 [Deinococcus radiophilus]UFA50387.1 hypothetical protein LMT64_00215 [Deinococcus radiophilus]
MAEAPPQTQDWERLSAYYLSRNYTYAADVQVGGRRERVYLTPLAPDGGGPIDAVRATVDPPTASAAQREAMIRAATGSFNVCWPAEAQALNGPFWEGLVKQPWEQQLGWQEESVGVLKVGWSGEDGLELGDHEVAGLTIDWPAGGGQCVF